MHLPILKKLKEGGLIIDGAMGTMLQVQGLPLGTPSSLWNLEKSEEVKKVHEAYIKAGAQMILTNTFSVKRDERLIKTGVDIAKEASGGQVYIGGSIGPIKKGDRHLIYQKYLDYFNQNSLDLIVLETMVSKKEIAQFLEINNQSKKIPLMVMMTVNEGDLLPSGENFKEVVSFLNAKEVPIIGFNCSLGPQSIYPHFQTLKKITDAFIAIKPNAGIPIQRNNQLTYPVSPEEFVQWGKRFFDEGVNLIGGCCGTTPEMIQELVKKGTGI